MNNNKKFGVVLYDLNNSVEKDLDGNDKPCIGIIMKMQYCDRFEVNEYFKCEYDYSKCGFTATVKMTDIDITNGEYQIVFKPEEEGEKGIVGNANAYLDKGELIYINPKDKIELDVAGTDLEPIIKNGICVASCPEYGICIYQNNWKLFWITNSDFKFENDNSTRIEWQLRTTQFNNLPKERTENGWYWSNIGDIYEKYEITNTMNCGKYRVSARDIPVEYSIVRESTGYYLTDK